MARTPASEEPREKAHRRVYVLPFDLVDRIGEYQKALGLASEVEAVRRLLDDALKRRDDLVDIVGRFIAVLKDTKSLREATRSVIADHPLVKNISFAETGAMVTFILVNGDYADVYDTGKATLFDPNQNTWGAQFFRGGVPSWASKVHHPPKGSNRTSDAIDDDIPF